MSLKAVILDCDGIIADDEMLHLAAFCEALRPLGIEVSKASYLARYLGFDDQGALRQALIDHEVEPHNDLIAALAEEKARIFRRLIEGSLVIYPGVVDLVRELSRGYRLAVASGALREEIDLILDRAGLSECFQVIVSAENVTRGKPDPEPFTAALRELSRLEALQAGECLVVEDSLAGIEAAKRAGMRCLAVTNSYSRYELARLGPDLIVDTLAGLRAADLAALFDASPRRPT